MAIVAVPQLKDNYAYLVIDDASKQCGVVDCSEADKVLAEVSRRGLKLVAVLPTHWHADHVGGNQDLVRAVPGLRVYGARGEGGRIPAMTDEVEDGSEVAVGPIRGRVIGIPAHTSGHIAYYFPALKAVFTGDTLFIAGCGRVFEGKADTMVASLGRLAALPDDTQVYCGHEYTEKNLQFALTLEPNNSALKNQILRNCADLCNVQQDQRRHAVRKSCQKHCGSRNTSAFVVLDHPQEILQGR